MAKPGYRLDGRLRRLGRAGEVLLGGEPVRLVRLSLQGAAVLDALVTGDPPAGDAAAALGRRLGEAGMLHPLPPPRSPAQGEVVVVIPAHDDDAAVGRLLGQLAGELAESSVDLVVVDDGSRPSSSARLADLAAAADACLVSRPDCGGPAAARNASREATDAPLVAFLDADVSPSPGWLQGLLGHFDDPVVGAVAPRVRTAGEGPLARFESASSPLDLGPEPGQVGAHRRLSYVPSAALVCRRAALDSVGWFDAHLRVGEDVDLARRLEGAGWVLRYEPRSVALHAPRRGPALFARQRFDYGTSAAPLERRHPGTVAPFEAGFWQLAGAGAAVGLVGRRGRVGVVLSLAGLLLWLAAIGATARALEVKLRRAGDPRATADALSMGVRAQAFSLAGMLRAVRRVWWPALVVVSVGSAGARRPVARVLLAAHLLGCLERARRLGEPAGAVSFASTAAYGLLDDAAYGAGVWAGCLRCRSLRALLPQLRPPSAIGEPGRSARAAPPWAGPADR